MLSVLRVNDTILSLLQQQNHASIEFNNGLRNENSIFSDGEKPGLVVFDCDYTIWPFDCHKNVEEPFWMDAHGMIKDRFYRNSNPYKDVVSIIEGLIDADIPIAYASRNPSQYQIEQLLRAIPINPKSESKKHIRNMWELLPSKSFFHAYSSDGGGQGKTKHFQTIKELTGIPFNKMIFFDDLPENIQCARPLGITSVILGKSGLTWRDINTGFNAWRSYQKSLSPV
jgi:magnesium-dependent phosphatase 1